MAQLILNFSGDSYQGPPVAHIVIDGTALPDTAVTAAHGVATTGVSASIAPGPHTISVNMVQDAYGGSPSTDRNLYLESVTLDGVDQKISANLMTATPSTFTLTVPAAGTVDLSPVLEAVAALHADVDAGNAATLAAIEGLQADMDAKFAALASSGGPAASGITPISAVVLNTSFPAGWMAITLSPTDSLQAAFAAAGKGFVATLAAGTYKQVANVPAGLDGWTIKSASGNYADVTIDGGGGLTVAANNAAGPGTPGRLSQGKGVLHLSSPGTIQGITVTGGGLAATDGHDGQAGVYWECSNGTASVLGCLIEGNQNGIFGNSSNTAIHYVTTGTIFRNNGVDGGSHDTYLGCNDLASTATYTRCIANGSNAGNNFKSRVSSVTVTECFLGSAHNNRWVDCADGAVCTMTNNVLVGNDTGQNVFANGDESTSKGPGKTSFNGDTIYVGNRGQDLYSPGGITATGVTVLFTGPAGMLMNSTNAGLGGMPSTPPAGVPFTAYPAVPTAVPAAA